MSKALAIAASVGFLAACGPQTGQDLAIKQATQSYRFEILADSLPPHANEDIHYSVRVIDRSTNQPVQNGEGQIYGQGSPGGRPYTWNALDYGPEVGIYHAKLRFAVPADGGAPWQMGLRFHRDSLSPLEVTNWSQQVLPERDNIKPPS
jgi:hypothetical protein